MAPTGEARLHIGAPAEQLWAMVADVTRMGSWSPETAGCEWLEGATGPLVGARFRGRNRRGKARWSTTCLVTACEPGREFAFTVQGRQGTRWRYTFRPDGDGTEVTESFELPKPLGFFDRLTTRLTTGVRDRPADLQAGMVETLRRLKQAAEATASG